MHKILVIEDEISMCEMIKSFFTNRGYEVIYALTGQGGLDAFGIEKPRVVMLDLFLKDMSGLEVLKNIKSHPKSCIVIVITWSTLEDDKRKAISLGADFYIEKPFSIEKLNRLLSRLLN